MGMQPHLRRLFAYDGWANREVLAAIKQAADQVRPRQLLAHIIGAEWLWLGRLQQEKPGMAVWPDLELQECEQHLQRLSPAWQDYLSGLTPESSSREVAYVNSHGESWSSAIEDILLHVVMHSAYHRGQIATAMRAAGHVPAYTDFIHCVRQGFVE